jgi:effector-binding domain-containing protein
MNQTKARPAQPLIVSGPSVEQRSQQPYMGIRTQVPMKAFSKIIPSLLDEVFAWLGKQGIPPAGAPFIRYHVIDMAGIMDVELGVPASTDAPGDGRVQPGVLPAGQYAALVYRGNRNGIKGNRALLDWAAQQGLALDHWSTEKGDAFASRYESFLSDPAEEPHQDKWETEVAIRLKDLPAK